MARPANAAVRESRRRSTPLDVERMNVMKALTAAEYSRRQFILNFAASRDTQLLIPGQKSDAVKAAEEWVAVWLNQTGFDNVNNEFFKYTVDARLWIAHGMSILILSPYQQLTRVKLEVTWTSHSPSCVDRPKVHQSEPLALRLR
jgi:hypothetical protein